jgi:hypothetical protein
MYHVTHALTGGEIVQACKAKYDVNSRTRPTDNKSSGTRTRARFLDTILSRPGLQDVPGPGRPVSKCVIIHASRGHVELMNRKQEVEGKLAGEEE